ncbi:hypothetical protein M409DRAFT_59047 [Zasmidium cellare ATCC 36951]|uniref:Uncharacterized protein n=1 Tax=Zasmidium cellare ATCC 36951 TaxID=1080233 RepID=A0A6A6C3F1_ZASCE|nr:uncharacterized protein M409DRAFT_59047 [Zasmidium cellare ATCC 36951]KAF2161667.1 hypothetical protein M409DRAFT_59047 [Zasmidium cellare ATCC 36951]
MDDVRHAGLRVDSLLPWFLTCRHTSSRRNDFYTDQGRFNTSLALRPLFESASREHSDNRLARLATTSPSHRFLETWKTFQLPGGIKPPRLRPVGTPNLAGKSILVDAFPPQGARFDILDPRSSAIKPRIPSKQQRPYQMPVGSRWTGRKSQVELLYIDGNMNVLTTASAAFEPAAKRTAQSKRT